MVSSGSAALAARAAEGTLLAVVAILVFSLVYAWASARFEVAGSMLLALLAWAGSVATLQALRLPLGFSFVLAWCAMLLTGRLFPAAVLVLAVTAGAAHLGARLSGFFAMFPVMSTVLVGFAHAGSGCDSAVSLLRGLLIAPLEKRNAIPILQQSVQPAPPRGTTWLSPKKKPLAFKLK